jgi:hypothetical protein
VFGDAYAIEMSVRHWLFVSDAKQTGPGSRHEPVPHHNAKVLCSALGSLGPFPILQVSTRIVLTIAVLELTPDPSYGDRHQNAKQQVRRHCSIAVV